MTKLFIASAFRKQTLARMTAAERREASRLALLKYKQELEFEFLRVNDSLNEGTAENFEPNRRLGYGKPPVDLVKRKPGARYVKDTKIGPEPDAKVISAMAQAPKKITKSQ